MDTVFKIILLTFGVLLTFAMHVHSSIVSQKIREMEEKKKEDTDSWETIEVKVPKRVLDKRFNEPEK